MRTIAIPVFLFAFLLPLSVSAQLDSAQKDSAQKGKVIINVDESVKQYLENRKQERQSDTVFKGYRIQLMFTDKRADAKAAKEKFQSMYPNCPAYLIYDSPNFKVRVGNFATQLDAQALLFKLIPDFPTLFLVEERVSEPPLIPCY